MNLKEALVHARDILTRNNIDDASLEAEILLRHVLKITRAQLYQELDAELSKADEDSYSELIARRQHVDIFIEALDSSLRDVDRRSA